MSPTSAIRCAGAALAPTAIGVAMALALHAWMHQHPCTNQIDLALTGPQLPLCYGADKIGGWK